MLGRQTNDTEIVLAMDNINSLNRRNEIPLREGFKETHEDDSKVKDDEDKQYSIRYLILDYCDYTSGHGPPRILASKQLIRKIFWTLLFLAALGVSIWQIYSLFQKYEKRPLSTHVSIQHETVRDH